MLNANPGYRELSTLSEEINFSKYTIGDNKNSLINEQSSTNHII